MLVTWNGLACNCPSKGLPLISLNNHPNRLSRLKGGYFFFSDSRIEFHNYNQPKGQTSTTTLHVGARPFLTRHIWKIYYLL